MAYRKRVGRRKSRRGFRRSSGVHAKNNMTPFRGGYRI